MKIDLTGKVDYDEVDTSFRIKLAVLFQRFQRAALQHSEQVGLGPVAMAASGGVWILNRMRLDLLRLPMCRETVTVRTWHRGASGLRAGRDFLVRCGAETVAAATTQWLYLDLRRQRVLPIPAAVADPYTREADAVLEAGAMDFRVHKSFEPQALMTLISGGCRADFTRQAVRRFEPRQSGHRHHPPEPGHPAG